VTSRSGPPEAVEVVLADGGSALVRAVRPDDAPRLAAFHRALSLETIHFRYFSGLCELPPLILRRFTEVDFGRDMVLLAEVGERMIALASWHRGKAEDGAEVAFVVADEHQGRGLGTILLERLAELARERGLTRFRADTLAGNRAMLRVFRDAGFALERESDDAAVVHLRFAIGETESSRGAHDRREHLAEARSIARLLAPRALWLTGERAADTARLRALGYAGGLYTDLERVPPGVDLVLFRGRADELPGLVAQCAAAGAHALVLDELRAEPEAAAERALFDHELRIAVRRNGMRLVGPDSLGVVNTAPDVALCTAPLAQAPTRGGLALACDSRALALELLEREGLARAGLSSFVGLGRRADVSANDLLQYWQDDPATRAVALAAESPGNPRKLERIGAALTARKPLLALASGGEHDALLRRAGAELFDTPQQLAARARSFA
jgi:GNAT superfamily N-acetyltransferase